MNHLAGCALFRIIHLVPAMNDDELHSLIRETAPQPEFPISFQREVWARIAVAEQRSWAARWQQRSQALFLWLAHPAPAMATVLVTVGLGVGLGIMTASNSKEDLRTAYVSSINPLTTAHAAMPE